MKRTSFAICIIALLLMSGCSGDVKKAAVYMTNAADALGEAQNITIDAYKSELISKDIHDGILRATLKANQTGREVTDILTALEQSGVKNLDSGNKQKIIKYLSVISAAIDPNAIAEIAGIQDTGVKLKIQTALEAARTALTAFDLMIAVGD
jgi:hypothetical protein